MWYTWAKIILTWESSFFNCLEISFPNTMLVLVQFSMPGVVYIYLFVYLFIICLPPAENKLQQVKDFASLLISPSPAPKMVFDSRW